MRKTFLILCRTLRTRMEKFMKVQNYDEENGVLVLESDAGQTAIYRKTNGSLEVIGEHLEMLALPGPDRWVFKTIFRGFIKELFVRFPDGLVFLFVRD